MIKILFFVSLVHFVIALSHQEVELKYKSTVHMLKNRVRKNGCGVNVCFAFDTSIVTPEDYDSQKNFIIDITAIIGTDPRARFSATQYGEKHYKISHLTSNVGVFNQRVQNTLLRNDDYPIINAATRWCTRQLKGHKKDVNKMVLMGDGRNNFRGDPVRRADTFRTRVNNSYISAVGVGMPNTHLFEQITRNASQVFTVSDYVELSYLVDDLVKDICGFSIF